jgi:hypothetical protein
VLQRPVRRLVNDRFNYLTPTKKPNGFGTDRNGRRTRLYDKPKTPLDRLLAAKVLAPSQEAELVAYRDSLNPAAIGRQIADLQAVLLKLAKDNTQQLYLASIPTALPDVRKGIRIKASRPARFAAFLIEAPINFRGHIDLRHYGPRSFIASSSRAGRSVA